MNSIGRVVILGIVLGQLALAQTRTSVTIRGRSQEVYLYGTRGSTPVILSSGDLGWAGLVTHVAEFLEHEGFFVVGVNTRAYLSSFTTKCSTLNPKDVPKDYQVFIDLASRGQLRNPILVGISEGAGLSLLAATAPDVRSNIQGVLGLGLPDEIELGWKWQDFTTWITKKAPNEPIFRVHDFIHQVSPAPLAEIHSSHDEFLPPDQAKALLALAGEPKKMWVIEAANHRFSDNRVELFRRLMEAFDWIHSRRLDNSVSFNNGG